jgi:hypothetical protein
MAESHAATSSDREEERKAKKKAWYMANRERIRAMKRTQYEANREKIAVQGKAYREANRETLKERCRAYYHTNKETAKVRRKAHYETNKAQYFARNKVYVEANREKVRAYLKDYYAANKDRARTYNYVRKFGISESELESLFQASGDRCQICNRPFSEDSSVKRCIDHCHATGRVRGVVCGQCNCVLGYARDDPAVLLAAVRYLKAHDACEKNSGKVGSQRKR